MATWDNMNNNVWSNQTDFDYNKWDAPGTTQIKFMSVKFDAHSHVVDWKDETSRDQYFDRKSGHVINMPSGWNFKSLEVFKPGLGKHEGSIRVDIPYEQAINFNYLAVEMFEQPVPGATGIGRRETYFYFLTSLNKIAPSTTEIYMELDTWTTYFGSFSLESIRMTRGHHFATQTTVDEFLADPLAKNFGLTDPEPELPSVKTKVSGEKFISVATSEPRICFSMTGDLKDTRSWAFFLPEVGKNPDTIPMPARTSTPSDSQDAAWNSSFLEIKNDSDNWASKPNGDNYSYSEDFTTGEESWNQYDVMKRETHWTEYSPRKAWNELRDYGSATEKISVGSQRSDDASGLRVYSMTPQAFANFINWARNNNIFIFKSIRAVYVLNSQLISESDSFSAFGFSFKEVQQQSDPKLLGSVKIDKSMIGYPAAYSEWTKLYNGQFTEIEISSLQGRIATVSIEEVSRQLDIYSRCSSMFPFLKLEAFVDGVGGRGAKTYAVRPLQAKDATVFASRYEELSFDLPVPVYSVYAAADQVRGQERKEEQKRKARAVNVERGMAYGGIVTDFINGNLPDRQANRTATYRTFLERKMKTRELQMNRDLGYSNLDLEVITDRNIATLDRNLASGLADIARANSRNSLGADNSNVRATLAVDLTNELERNFYYNWTRFRRTNINNYALAQRQAEREINSWPHVSGRIEEAAANEKSIASWYKGAIGSNQSIMATARATLARSKDQLGMLYEARSASLGLIGGGLQIATGGSPAGVVSNVLTGLNAVSIIENNSLTQLASTAMGYGTSGSGTGIISHSTNFAGNTWSYYGVTSYGMDLRERIGGQVNAAGGGLVRVTGTNEIDEERIIRAQDYIAGRDIVLQERIIGSNMRFDKEIALMAYENARVNGDEYGIINTLVNRKNATDGENQTRTYNATYQNIDRTRDAARLTYENTYTTTSGKINTFEATTSATVNKDYVLGQLLASFRLGPDVDGRTATSSDGTGGNVAMVGIDAKIALRDRYVINQTKKNSLLLRDAEATIATLSARDEFNSQILTEAKGEPLEVGVTGGEAWVDSWGLKGIQVRVKRVPDAVAQQADQLFRRYGYKTSGLFVQKPSFRAMTKFTYIQGIDPWVVGEEINETNKAILRKIFSEGVTIWTDEESIFNVSITANARR